MPGLGGGEGEEEREMSLCREVEDGRARSRVRVGAREVAERDR